MVRKIIITLFFTLSFITVVISCSSNGDNNQELKSVSSLKNQNLTKKQVMTETTYDVTVDLDRSSFISSIADLPIISTFLNTKNSTCSGTSKLILYNDYSQKLEGKLKCLGILDIDLSDAMGDNDVERVEEDMSKYSFFGSILRENNPVITDKKIPEGTAYFQPPRPVLINPMVPADTIEKKMSENTTMVFINSNTKEQVKTNGVFTIEIKNPKAEIPEGVDPSYIKGDIVHIDMQSSGFNGVDNRSKYLLFNSREMFISLKPIIITKMVIHTSVKDLINKKNPDGPVILSNLVGDITINFVMNKHEIK